ncbi:hypothetical protein HELRODRAFT_181224 [Helobdella robusta]|uniref:Uncharacterized protein n=1 Tax=Helobdella robusta TaxID=6412 RepID=T1FGR9_HELRO|nr:hypothetical protein HELRODRAFT_181224 [Helobdella robusta]ESN93128.1 hypothetical protein HELRODRAFT_181224 [Helobdella robusta]
MTLAETAVSQITDLNLNLKNYVLLKCTFWLIPTTACSCTRRASAYTHTFQRTEKQIISGSDRFDNRQMRIKDRILQKKKYLTTRNSISSVDSLDLVRMNVPPSARKRWTTLESAGRSLFVLSTILLLVGISITILGFIDLKMAPSHQLFLQIIGPACLMATAVMWVVGGVFCRLWTVEMQRQKHSMELRTRVQLHALAIDLLKNPQIFSTQALEDPQIRSQLLLKLRQQNALDTRFETRFVMIFICDHVVGFYNVLKKVKT